MLDDPDRLAAMARRQPFQVVFAGKAHPRDDGGKELIARQECRWIISIAAIGKIGVEGFIVAGSAMAVYARSRVHAACSGRHGPC